MTRDRADDALRDVGLDPADVSAVVARALDEDLRLGPDVTSIATIRPDAEAVEP